MSETHWLVLSKNKKHPYQLIKSNRAKYVRVKLSGKGELSVVVPSGVSTRLGHEFIQSRAKWVDKHLKKIPLQDQAIRPDSLELRMLGETWRIEYQQKSQSEIELIETRDTGLLIRGDVDNLDLVREVIVKWCKLKSRDVFENMLSDLATEYGFQFNRISIRAQKTRWGSCSSKKNINLNCKLLFMPMDVVRYVMVHELCHTLEMNHSQRFWALVERYDPAYQLHRKQLKSISKMLVV